MTYPCGYSLECRLEYPCELSVFFIDTNLGNNRVNFKVIKRNKHGVCFREISTNFHLKIGVGPQLREAA